MGEKAPSAPQQAYTAQDEQLRIAELQAYAMKPEMDMIANERAASRPPSTFILAEGGKIHEELGEVNLTTEQKHKHWQLASQAGHNANNVERYDATMLDVERPLAERKLARHMIHILTNPKRKPETRS